MRTLKQCRTDLLGLTIPDKKGRVPSYPTAAPPGSLLKVRIMEMRVARGEQPHHPGDQQWMEGMRADLFAHANETNGRWKY